MKRLCAAMILTILCAAAASAQGPWSHVIPDPDTYNWSSNDRPGYRYRGMLPEHRRFFDYVRAKRPRGEALSSVEAAMVRRLQKTRRWPEAPVPNEFWKSFLRYLREQPSADLNFAQRYLLSEAFSRGLIPADRPVGDDGQKLVDYLQGRSYRARTRGQRWFGRVEPWLDSHIAASGVDMRDHAGGGGGGVFPPDKALNGLRINYSVSGINLTGHEDHTPAQRAQGGWRRVYEGTVSPGRITISGTGIADVGYTARGEVYVRVGRYEAKEEFEIEPPGRRSFDLTLDVPDDADLAFPRAQFGIRLTGSFSTAGSGFGRTIRVYGTMEADPAAISAQRDRADAEWRAEVERTLRELGYEQTPEGRELERMRAALAGGDHAWRDYVDMRQRELGYREGPEEAAFDGLERAMEAGGDTWAQYMATGTLPPPGPVGAHGPTGTTTAPPVTFEGGAEGGSAQQPGPPVDRGAQGGPPATDGRGGTGQPPTTGRGATAPPAIGGLQVGTGIDGGTLTGAGRQFHNTSRVTGAMSYQNLPPDSTAIAIWTRNGQELARGRRSVGGTGSQSFTLRTEGGENLPDGDYTLTVMVGDNAIGRTSFVIGQPQGRPTIATDAQAHALAITEPAADQAITRHTTIRGTAPPGSRVRVTASYWYRVLVEGYSTLHEKEVTADAAGNWTTEELDMRPPLSGMSRSYRIKVEQLNPDDTVAAEQMIEVRGNR